VVVNRSVLFEAYGELHPFDPPHRLCSLGSIMRHTFVSLLLDDFAKSTTPLVSSPLLIRKPTPSSPSMTALNLKRRRHEHAFSWPPCKLWLTPCAGNSTIGSLLTGWQAVQIAALPWIVLIHPGTSQARTYKMEHVISLHSGKRTKL
jgi:hypothetical protein